MNGAYNGHLAWNGQGFRFAFTWLGYQYGSSTKSRYWDGAALRPTTANETNVTQTAVGALDLNAQARTSVEWGSYNYSTGRYDIRDGDTLIAPGAMNVMYCGTAKAPDNNYDIRNIVGHEKGHTLGLGDVYASTNGADIMYGYTRMGAAPIAISPNDRGRAIYLYGQ